MIKKLTPFLALFTILLLPQTVAAQATDGVMTADHPLYQTKLAAEAGEENLAPNASAEAEAKVGQADSRVAEMDKLSSEGRDELVNETGEAYSEEMQEVNDLGSEVSALAQKQEINELVATATQHHQDVLQTVLDRVPEQARQGIQQALDNAQTGHQQASTRVAESLMEQGRQDLAEGNDQLDRGDNTAANQSYRDAQETFGQAEQWAEQAGTDGSDLVQQARDAREGAMNMGLAAQAYIDGDTAAAEQYGQQAQQAFDGGGAQ